MSSVTLTNNFDFTETSRSIQRSAGMLDTLTSVYIVPTYKLALFIPAIGAAHSSFPLMQVWSVNIGDQAGGVLSDLSVTYKGRLTTSGKSSFVSESVLSEDVTEKEFSYATQTIQGGPESIPITVTTTSFATGTATANTQQSFITVAYPYRVISYNWAIRYLTNTVKYRYCCNFDPTGSPQFQTQGFNKCAIEYQFTTLMSRSTTDVATTSSLPVLPSSSLQKLLVSMSVNQFNSWYECEEVYEERWVLS